MFPGKIYIRPVCKKLDTMHGGYRLAATAQR